MPADKGPRERKFQLWGWILFLICAGFFIASGASSGDVLAIAGSIVFLIGCIIFIIPLKTEKSQDEDG